MDWRREVFSVPNMVTAVGFLLVATILMAAVNMFGPAVDQWVPVFVAAHIVFVTDGLDGYLARLLGQETEVGKWMDTIRDKVALAVCLYYIFVLGVGLIEYIGFSLLVFREGCIMVQRTLGIVDLTFSKKGKWKTGVQMGMISLYLMHHRFPEFEVLHLVAQVSLALALFMTYWSWLDYAWPKVRGFLKPHFERIMMRRSF